MPISPLTIAFPLGGLAALVAWALGEKDADASKLPDKDGLSLNGVKWGECPAGYRPKWNADHTSMVCEKIPEFEVLPAAPGEVPRAVQVDNGKPLVVPVQQTKPSEAVPHPSQTKLVETPSGGTAVIVAKPVEKLSNVAATLEAKQPKTSKEKPVKEVLAKKEKEEPSKSAKQAAEASKKKTEKKAVTLAQWQADMKKKQTNNNCGPTEKPQFDPYTNTWAEYKCVLASTIKVVSTGPLPSSASDVAKTLDKKQKETEPSKKEAPSKKETSFEIPKVERVSDKVDKFLKTRPSPSQANAMAVELQFTNPVEASKLRNYANEQEAKADRIAKEAASEKPSKETPSKVSKVLSSKQEPITFEPTVLTLSKPSAEKKEEVKAETPSTVAQVISKKQWEDDKKYKQSHNNCQEGYEPTFKSYNKGWADYQCKPSEKVKKGMAALKAEGIESDMEEKIAIFLSNNPSATDARSLAAYYEGKKPKAVSRLKTYAQFQEHLEVQKEKNKPTKPAEVAKAIGKTNNPVELMNHAKTLEAQGDKRGAKAVADLAKNEAAKRGEKFVDEKEAIKLVDEAKKNSNDISKLNKIAETLRKNGYVKKAETVEALMVAPDKGTSTAKEKVEVKKKVVETSTGTKAVPVVQTLAEKQAEYEKTQKKEKKVSEKQETKSKEQAKKDEEASRVAKELLRKTSQPGAEDEFMRSLDEEKPGDADKKKKKKDKVSGYGDSEGFVNSQFNDGYNPEDSNGISVESPIDGVSDTEWLAFVQAMKVARPQTVTPSYALGMFGFGMRRLEDYGIVENARQTNFRGNTVWSGDWVSPWNLDAFLNDAIAQYELFEKDIANKSDYIKEADAVGKLIEGRKATLSGLLAVAFKTTEASFNRWLVASRQERIAFPVTMQLFEKANGIF